MKILVMSAFVLFLTVIAVGQQVAQNSDTRGSIR